MTISSTLRRAGPFTGNSIVTTFPFAFKIFDKTDVEVVRTDSNAAGAETILVLDSDYSVTLNADQNANPGGTITYPITGTAFLSSTQQLTTIGSLAYLQPTDITNSGGFYPSIIEDALDREVILSQQLQEIVSRAIVLPITEQNPPELPPAAQRADTLFGFDALGNLELMPISASVGAGNLTPEVFVNGVDFVAGTSNSITVGQAYGTKANLGTVVMAGIAQAPDSYDLNARILTFNALIPLGVDKIWFFGGTTLSLQIPPPRSVGDSQLAWGSTLFRSVDSAAALALLNPTIYTRAKLTGLNFLGDGFGGDYFYNAAFSQALADGKEIIAAAGGVGCWILMQITLPQVVLSVSAITQPGAIANTNFFLPQVAGLYRINYFLTITVPGTGGTFTPQILFSDGITGRTVQGNASPVTAGGYCQGSFYVYSVVAEMLYGVVAAGVTGAPQYSLYLTAERLS